MPDRHLATLGEDPGLRGPNMSTNCTNYVRSLCKLGVTMHASVAVVVVVVCVYLVVDNYSLRYFGLISMLSEFHD